MVLFKITIFAISTMVAAQVSQEEYCQLCDDHTMCQFSGPGDQCVIGDGNDSSGVSEEDQQLIVDVHNQLRRKVTKGHEKRTINGPMPKAANMRKMRWDDELARVAQMWADQCLQKHDHCRNDPRFYVGQNYFGIWESPPNPAVNWTEAIYDWYDEALEFDRETVEKYDGGAGTGHFTQVIWHDSENVGCGRRTSVENKYFFCNYGPGGNSGGSPIYKKGKPCSACEEGDLCDDGLCESSNAKLSDSVPYIWSGI